MKKSRIYTFFFLIFIFTAAPIFPRPARAITIREEKNLWKEFYQTLSMQYTIIDDPIIDRYINRLGTKIVAAAPPQPFKFHFYVIRQDAINAFAAPAGHIFVYSGLFAVMENEDELAGILSHEIAHATCRHISTMIEESKKTNMMTLAGIAAGILMGLGGAPSAGSALAFGSVATGQTVSLAYSREHEMQADKIGRSYLIKAGYNLFGLIGALKIIRSQEWFGKETVPAYLTTHPATGDRIVYLDNLIKGEKAPLPKKSYEFDLARARLIGMYEDIDTALALLSDMLAKNPKNPAILYGYGLALARKGNFKKGISIIRKAIEIKNNYTMRADLGRIIYLSGKTGQAVEVLSAIPGLERLGPSGLVYLARAFLDEKKVRAAISTCEKLLSAYPDNTEGLNVCGRTFGHSGDMANAHYYLGKYYEKTGDISNSRFHFTQALAATTDTVRKKEIEKRLSDLSRRPRQPLARQIWQNAD